jgi:hypothetical protein
MFFFKTYILLKVRKDLVMNGNKVNRKNWNIKMKKLKKHLNVKNMLKNNGK